MRFGLWIVVLFILGCGDLGMNREQEEYSWSNLLVHTKTANRYYHWEENLRPKLETGNQNIDGCSDIFSQQKGLSTKWKMKGGWLSSKMRNIIVRARNGNRGGIRQTIKLIHWNMGNGWWEGKIAEIEAAIIDFDPDLFFITEANLRADIPSESSQIEGYEMVFPETMESQGYARIMLLIKEGIKYKKLTKGR